MPPRLGRILPRVNQAKFVRPDTNLERFGKYSAKTIRSLIGVDRRVSNLNEELISAKRQSNVLSNEFDDISNFSMKTVVQSDFITAARIFLNAQYSELGQFYRRPQVTNIKEKNLTAKQKVFERIFQEITDTSMLYKKSANYDRNARNAYIIFCGKSTFSNLSIKTKHGKKCFYAFQNFFSFIYFKRLLKLYLF